MVESDETNGSEIEEPLQKYSIEIFGWFTVNLFGIISGFIASCQCQSGMGRYIDNYCMASAGSAISTYRYHNVLYRKCGIDTSPNVHSYIKCHANWENLINPKHKT